MSDAMSDIARDEERNKRIEIYFEWVKKYLKNPTKYNLKKAIKAAKAVDNIPAGYFQEQTALAKNTKKQLKILRLWVECGVVEVK